ncbi:unnamed protein product [Ambrosiozyma monospora]|uniref:Unnamed protein product n=1 Tax=Ambrosiozyma monospora TaxID=43982 RepID=A0ACB5TXZ6_AMBMO|nr:unnamed protein product [Ambrosiozyma monospora]
MVSGAPQPPLQQVVGQPEEPFYMQTNLFPMNYHLYAPQAPPHIDLNKKANERTVADIFIPDRLREYIQRKNEESLKSIPNTQAGLPFHVNQYHSLFPIDQNFDRSVKSFGFVSTVYKCMSNDDGRLYTMRRIEGVPIISTKVFKNVKRWQQLDCANIVSLREVFTTRSFGDNSLILIYDYYPMSLTLMESHFIKIGNNSLELITEELLWNYLVQLTNAIVTIHSHNLTVSAFDPSKIIVTNKGRIRLSACGVYDIIRSATSAKDSPEPDLKEQQQHDIKELGSLILNFARSTAIINESQDSEPQKILEQLKFSEEFKHCVSYLFEKDARLARLQELIAPQLLRISNGLQDSSDYMESWLSREVENARLVRDRRTLSGEVV